MVEDVAKIEAKLRWALSKPIDHLFLLGRGSDLSGVRADENKNGELIRYQCYWNYYKANLSETQRKCVIWCVIKRDLLPFWSAEIARRLTGEDDPMAVADGAIRDLAVAIHRAVYAPETPQDHRSASFSSGDAQSLV